MSMDNRHTDQGAICRGCGRALTEDESYYYETHCEDCERSNHEMLNEQTPWIKCSERMPEDCRMVLVFGDCENELRIGLDVCWRYDGRWTSWFLKNITHWMPLPNSPKEMEETT